MLNLHPGHSSQRNLTEILSRIWRDVRGRSASSFRSCWNPPVLIKGFLKKKKKIEILYDSNKWTFPRNSAAGGRWFLKLFSFFSLDHLSCEMVPLPGVFQFWGHLWEELHRIHLNLYLKMGVLFHHSSLGDCVACGKSRLSQFFTCSDLWLGYF